MIFEGVIGYVGDLGVVCFRVIIIVFVFGNMKIIDFLSFKFIVMGVCGVFFLSIGLLMVFVFILYDVFVVCGV